MVSDEANEKYILLGTTPRAEKTGVYPVALSPVSSLLAEFAISDHRTLRIIDYETQKTHGRFAVDHKLHTLSFSADGRSLLALDSGLLICRDPWKARSFVRQQLPDRNFHGAWMDERNVLIAGAKDSFNVWIAVFDVKRRRLRVLNLETPDRVYENKTISYDCINHAFVSPSGLIGFVCICYPRFPDSNYCTVILFYQLDETRSAGRWEEGYFFDDHLVRIAISEDGQTILFIDSSQISLNDRQGRLLISQPCGPKYHPYWITYRNNTVLVCEDTIAEVWRLRDNKLQQWCTLKLPRTGYSSFRGEIFIGYSDLAQRDGETYLASDSVAAKQTAVYRLRDFDLVQLSSTKPDERLRGAEAIGRRGYRPAVPKLTTLIMDTDPPVRQAAINALAKIGDSQALHALIAAAGTQSSDDVGGLLLTSIAGFPEDDLRAAVTDCLSSTEAGLRLGSVRTLEHVQSIGMVDALLQALTDPEAEIRMAAAHALGKRGSSHSVPALIRALLEDEDSGVQETAAESLGEIRDPVAMPYLIRRLGDQASTTLQDEILTSLSRFPGEDLNAAVLDCLTQAGVTRRGAVLFVTHAPIAEALEEMVRALTDGDAQVRQQAACALGRIGDPRGCVALLGRLNDENLQVSLAVQQAAIDLLDTAESLSVPVPRLLATRLNLASYANQSISSGQMNAFAEQGDPAGSFLVDLSSAAIAGSEFSSVLNAIQSLSEVATLGEKAIALVVALICAEARRAKERWAEAANVYEIAVPISRTIQASQIEWRAWGAIGECQEAMGGDPLALEAYRLAMQVIDREWFGLLEDDKLRGFFRDKAALYDRASLCALRLGHGALSLEIVEKSKTRYLGDLIARRQKGPRTVLQEQLLESWGVGGQTRALEVATGESTKVGKLGREIVGIARAGNTTGGNSIKPKCLAAFEEAITGGDDQLNRRVIRPIWDLSSLVAALGDDTKRHSLEDIYHVVHQIRLGLRADRLPLPAVQREVILMQLKKAVSALSFAPVPNEDRWYPSLEEFVLFIEELVSAGIAEKLRFELALDAVLEALNLVLHHEPVCGVPGEPMTGDQNEFVFLLGTDEGSPGTRQRTTVVESALERRLQTEWRYVTQVARGEISHFRDIIHGLRGDVGVAQLQFAVTDQGTVAYIAQGRRTAERSTSLIPDLRGKDNLQVFTFPNVTLSELHRRLWQGPESWFGLLRRRSQTGERGAFQNVMDRTLQWLHAEIVRPLAAHLKRSKVRRLRIIPHRALHLVPFAALHKSDAEGNRHFLIDDYEIEYAPSATILRICQERRRERGDSPGLTIVSDPTGDLSFAGYEAEQVIGSFGNNPVQHWSGDRAQLRELRGATMGSVFHFCGHGSYRWDDPLKSSMAFAGTDELQLGDLLSEMITFPQTNLAVLSACETSVVDPQDPTDEYLGLASGFLFGGTPAVISTLWAVDDLSTALLMKEFYRLLNGGSGIGSALRAAQRWLRNAKAHEMKLAEYWQQIYDASGGMDKDSFVAMRTYRANPHSRPFEHPYYWAAFTFSGV